MKNEIYEVASQEPCIESVRELSAICHTLVGQKRRALQNLRHRFPPGSQERAAVGREMRRHIRLERATARLLNDDGETPLIILVAELDLALRMLRSSPDATCALIYLAQEDLL